MTITVDEHQNYSYLIISWVIRDSDNSLKLATNVKHTFRSQKTTLLSLVPGPDKYQISVCGSDDGKKCKTKTKKEDSGSSEYINDEPFMWIKFEITADKSKLEEETGSEDINAIVILGKAMDIDCDQVFNSTDRSGIISFECLKKVPASDTEEFQEIGEEVRGKLYSEYKVENVLVSQSVSESSQVAVAQNTSGGGFMSYLFFFVVIGRVAYYLYDKKLKIKILNLIGKSSRQPWSSIRQYDEEEDVEMFHDQDQDNPAKDLVR
eukprot:UN23989